MTRAEYLLVCLLEELGEAAQAVSKALRFRLDNYHPDDPTTDNADLISHELNDVIAVAQMLQVKNEISHLLDRQMIRRKQDKLETYLLAHVQEEELDHDRP